MKKLITFMLAVLLTASLIAQVPQKMTYQAVLRNTTGELVKNQPIRMKVSILQGSEDGAPVFTQYLTPTTNINGLITAEIDISGVNWATAPYFIKTETDPNGGTNYTIVGVSKILSVPYSLYSKVAENALGGDYNNLINKPVLFGGDYNDLRNKPTLFDGKFTSLIDKPTTLSGYGITDAMTTSHPANIIMATHIDRWNNAFSWGDHSLVGYLKSTTTGINPNFMKVNLINTVNNGLFVYSTATGQWEVKPITDFTSIFAPTSHTHTETDPYFNQWFELTGNDDARPYDYMGWNGTKWVRTRNTFSKLDHQHPLVDVSGASGFMSFTDKIKLDGYPIPTTVGDFMVFDGLNWVLKSTTNFAGTTHSHALVTNQAHGFMSNADKIKLDGFPTPSVMGDIMVYDGNGWIIGSANLFSPINHTHDGSETKINSSADITVKGKGTVAEPYVLNQAQHVVGETYGGGVVFYVYDGGQHGLIAATADANINGNQMLYWIFNSSPRTAGAFANGVNAGKGNTYAMISMQASVTPTYPMLSTYSAAYAATYYQAQDGAGVRYNDWYLPSQYEMILMSNSTATIPGFSKSNYYWSSTETIDNPNYAYAVYQGSLTVQPKTTSFRVRPIRAF